MKNRLKILFLFLFTLVSNLSYGQILKGTGLVYTNGVPTHIPRTSTESEYAVDVSNNKGDLYLWNRTSNTWVLIGEGIDVAANSNVPSGAPGYGQSRFRINNVPTLYFWTGVTWAALGGADTNTNIYNINGTVTDQTRVVSIPGNLVFSNNSASVGEKLSISYDDAITSNNSIIVQEGSGISLVSSENNIFLEGQTSFRDVLNPSVLTGNVNNYTGLNGANVGILSSTGTYNVTGIDNGVHGRILFLFNNGNFDITLKSEDVLSNTENRFYFGSDYVLRADTGSAILMYDTLIPAWRIFKTGEGGGPGSQNLTIEGSGPTYNIAISGGTDVTIQGVGITLSESPPNTLVLTAVDPSLTNEIQQIDTFSIVGTIISASLSLDGIPAKTLNIANTLSVSGADSAFVKLNGSYLNKRITDAIYRYGTTGFRSTDTSGVINFNLANDSNKPAINFSGTTNYLLTASRPVSATHQISQFTMTNRLFPSASIAGDNQVAIWGFNKASGGGLLNLGRSGIGLHIEENYTNSITDTSGNFEVHIDIQYPGGTSVRPITGYFSNESVAKGGYWGFNSDILLFNNFAGTQKGWLSFDHRYSYTKGLTFLDTASIVLYKSAIAGIYGRKADNSAFITMLKTDSQDRVFLGGNGESGVAAFASFQITNNGNLWNENGGIIIGKSGTLNKLSIYNTQVMQTWGTTYGVDLLQQRIDGNDWTIQYPTGGTYPMFFDYRAPTYAFRINQSGNIGFGTYSPNGKMDLISTSGATGSMLRLENTAEAISTHVSNATPEGAITTSPGSFTFSEIAGVGRWWGKRSGTGNVGWVEFYHTGNLPAAPVTIYTGNGTVINRDIEINGFLNFNDVDGDAEFNVTIGTLAGSSHFMTGIENKLLFFDLGGTNTIVTDGSGIELVTSGTDNININSSTTVDITGDSILLTIVPTTTALKSITGFNTTNTLKKIVGDVNGDVLTWNVNQWESMPPLAGGVALGTPSQIFGVNAAGTANEYKTFLGTTNQVTITDGVGTKTWSLPQNIHTTAEPTFAAGTFTKNDPIVLIDDTGSSNSTSGGVLRLGVDDGTSIATGDRFGKIEIYAAHGGVEKTAFTLEAFADNAGAWGSSVSAAPNVVFSTITGSTLHERFRIGGNGEFQHRSAWGVRHYDSDNSNFVTIRPPANDSLTANYSLVLPRDDGSTGQVLKIRGDSLLYWANDISGSGADGNGIYGDGTAGSGSDNLPTGGSEITQTTTTNTLRMVSTLGATTLREMVKLKTSENAFTRFLVFTSPVDSLRMFRASAGRQYTMQTYGGTAFQVASDSIISFLADSIHIVEGTVQTKTKVKFLLGMTTSNYVKRLDGSGTIGEVMVSDGTDWALTPLSTYTLKVLQDFTTDVNNTGTGETDLYTYTIPADVVSATGSKIESSYGGTFNDITSTPRLKVYFAGTSIFDSGVLTISATGAWNVETMLIRTGTTTARVVVTVSTPGASTTVYTTQTDLTGQDFTITNIIKITGTATGAGGGSSDITSKLGTIKYVPPAY